MQTGKNYSLYVSQLSSIVLTNSSVLLTLQPIDLSPGDLLYYGGVEWLNISDFLGKIKKGLELHAMCFVFKSAVVFLCKERLRQKKKLMVNFLLDFYHQYFCLLVNKIKFKLFVA